MLGHRNSEFFGWVQYGAKLHVAIICSNSDLYDETKDTTMVFTSFNPYETGFQVLYVNYYKTDIVS